ncbi:MAG TPA: hypothetical protein VGK10_00035 [Prolixibacteraceae bacterium]|jgi:hypothetical protein
MEFLKVILLAVVIMVFVILGLATQIIFKKNGKFPNTHIGANKYMKDRGVTCAQTFDKMEQSKARKELRFKELTLGNSDRGE